MTNTKRDAVGEILNDYASSMDSEWGQDDYSLREAKRDLLELVKKALPKFQDIGHVDLSGKSLGELREILSSHSEILGRNKMLAEVEKRLEKLFGKGE